MTRYWKIIGGTLGGAVGIALAWLSVTGLSTCETVDGSIVTDTCEVMGFNTAQITGFLMLIFTQLGTLIAPKNT